MPNLRMALAAAAQRAAGGRERGPSVSNTVRPAETSEDYDPQLATIAASILYRSPLPSQEGRPIYILNSAAFPDAFRIDYNSLLSYVLARLPGEEELIAGAEYELIFLAGGQPDGATSEKRQGPERGWYVQAYHVLSRATRKKLKKLYIVHTRSWVRVLVILLSQIVSRKFSRKIENVSTLSQLALHIPIERLLLPPSAYLQDRKVSPEIYAPFVTGRRAFGARHPFPKNMDTGKTRLPRVLRETTSFICMPANIKIEGLFRIPPHSTLAGVLKEAYNRGQHFIVWKEPGAVLVQPGIDRSLVDEVQFEDAYGVHLAASLIKTWYRELTEPIFPVSCYSDLQGRFSNINAPVPIDDLVEIFSPTPHTSPLSSISREILTRHLLPLLSLVASHESENKMTAESLAVCFGMCLVCGPDQMQDAKMIPIIKHALRASTEAWPQLRVRLGIDETAFAREIKIPPDFIDYEDPLEEHWPGEVSMNESFPEDNKINMTDLDGSPERGTIERTPTLPPRRRSRAASLQAASNANTTKSDPLPTIPGRKPVPNIAVQPSAGVPDPPRYSAVFDNDGNSIRVADSPAAYAPVDGFGPPRRGDFSFDSNEEDLEQRLTTVTPPGVPPGVPPPIVIMPKRKAVSTPPKSEESEPHPPVQHARVTPESNNPFLAQIAAQQAAASITSRNATITPPAPTANHSIMTTSSSIATSPPVAINTLSTATTTPTPITPSEPELPIDVPGGSPAAAVPEDTSTFRKPSWPASAPRPIESLARPVHIPLRKVHTIPGVPIITTQPASDPPLGGGNNSHTTAGGASWHRNPSPGLLKRIHSMGEQPSTTDPGTARLHSSLLPQPRKLNLKKASVDDLRRLYEERATTARSMVSGSVGTAGTAGSLRRGE